MALVYSPTGQPIIVPDDMGAMFGAPDPQQIGTTEYGLLGSTTPSPQPPPPPPPPPQRIGPGGVVVEETAGPAPGAELPASVMDQIGVPNTGIGIQKPTSASPPVTPPAEFSVPVSALPKAPTPAEEKRAAQQAAKQAAYAASPEGRIARSEQEQIRSNQNQAAIVEARGDIEAKEADDVAALKAAGEGSADYWRQQNAIKEQERQRGIAERTAKIDAAVKAEADYKIDDNRKWHNLSTGRKVLAAISVALSGLGDALQGKTGPNLALGIITGAIKDDVEAQVREREQLGKRIGIARNSLDSYRAISADEREAGQLKVAEQYRRTAAQVEAAAARYASPKAKLNAALLSEQLNAEAAKLTGQHGEAAWNRDQQRQQMAMQRQQIGISGGHLALAQKSFDWQKKQQAAQLQLEAAKLSQAGKQKEAEEYLKRGIGGTAVPVKDKDGNTVDVTFEPLKQRDGKIWLPTGGEGAVDRLRNEKVATDRLLQIMDGVLAAGPEWMSDSRNSDKLQEMKADWAAAKLEVKDVKKLGVIAGPDLDLIEDFLGTPDPTRYKDSVAGITRARRNLVRGLNILMRNHDFTGTYDPPPFGLEKPAETPVDVATKGALAKEGTTSVDGNTTSDKLIANTLRIAKTGEGQAKRDAINLLMTLRLDSKSGPVRQSAAFALDELGIESTTGMPKGFGTPAGIQVPQPPTPAPTRPPQILGPSQGGMLVRLGDGSTKVVPTEEAIKLVQRPVP